MGAWWIRNGKIINVKDDTHGQIFLEDPDFFGFSNAMVKEICDKYNLNDLYDLNYDEDYLDEAHPAWDEMMYIALAKGAIRVRSFKGFKTETWVTYDPHRKEDLINAMLDYPDLFEGVIHVGTGDGSGGEDHYMGVENALKSLNESKKNLKENRFDKLEYMYIKGSYALIRKYEQGPFLKKILNGNTFDKLYRYVSAGKLKTKDNPFNVKNWKVGDDILLGLTSTLPFEDPKNLKKDLQVNFSYCMVFKNIKGYSVKYDAKDFAGWRGIEDYKWQKEVLTAGLFQVDNIEQKDKITYIELSTVKQDKETFIEILRKTREDLKSGEINKQYPSSFGVEGATYDFLKRELKKANLTIFNTNNLSQKDVEAIKKLPKVNTYEDLYYFIKGYDLYEDLKPLCIKEPPKEFTKEVWNNTLIDMRLALPEDTFPQDKNEAYNKWNCSFSQTKKWPKKTGEYIPFQNHLQGIWFIADKYFALKSIKEKLEKGSLKESTKTLKQFKVLYHGSKNGELRSDEEHKYNCLYVTPVFAYAALYSTGSDSSHGCVFEMRPIMPLNIFDANDEGALDQLKAKVEELYPDDTTVRRINWEALKTQDWSTVCFRRDDLRDNLLLKAVKELGYDGYINHEWDADCAMYYARGMGGCGLVENSISIGVFDENLLEIVDEKYFDDYSEDDLFNKCHQADEDLFITFLQDEGFDDYYYDNEEDAKEWAAENLLFLDVDEVNDLFDEYGNCYDEEEE